MSPVNLSVSHLPHQEFQFLGQLLEMRTSLAATVFHQKLLDLIIYEGHIRLVSMQPHMFLEQVLVEELLFLTHSIHHHQVLRPRHQFLVLLLLVLSFCRLVFSFCFSLVQIET